MVRNNGHQTFELIYITYYRVLKILNGSTVLLVTSKEKEFKMNINYVNPCTILELVENAWNSFLKCIKTYCPSHKYNLRPCD